MSGQYPVTATVTPIYESGQQTATTVKNAGLVTVYLGTGTSLSVLNGYALGPGSAVTWDAKKPLYAVCMPGASSTLSTLDNGGNLFDASAVAAQIQVSGAPPIDPMATVVHDVTNVAANASYNTAWFYVGGYQSITLRLVEATTSVYAAPLPRRVTVWWSDSANGIPFAEEGFFVSDTDDNPFGGISCFTTYRTAVKDSWIQVQWAATARAASLETYISGSYKTLSRPEYTHQTAYGALPAGWGGYGNALDRLSAIYTSSALFTNNVQYWWYPSVSAGAGYLNLAITPGGAMPAGGSFDVFVYAFADGQVYLYAKRSLLAAAFPFDDRTPLDVPFMPLAIFLRYNNASAGTWAPTASLTLTYER